MVFAPITFLQGAKAQYIWRVSHPAEYLNFKYSISALSCNGYNCTATGLVSDISRHTVKIIFFRSEDGGKTWIEQDPHLPIQVAQNQNQFIAIQQIDSLNAVAVGDTGLLVKTVDGGKTWEKQNLHTSDFLSDVHFSDPLTGIATGYDSIGIAFFTIDGGKIWTKITLGGRYNSQCHSYGNGKFRVFQAGLGPIYTTNDNWKTIDSTKLLIDSTQDSNFNSFFFANCNFSDDDTIIAYGNYLFQKEALLMRSTNAGKSWEKPVIFSKVNFQDIFYMTSLKHDTVLATGFGIKKFIISTDRGKTWNIDTLLLDTSYDANFCFGLAITANGNPLSAFSHSPARGADAILVRAEKENAHVTIYDYPINKAYLFPNPASNFLRIKSVDPLSQIELMDIFGRYVLHGVTDIQGNGIIDVSSLPRGMYDVLLKRGDKMLIVDKVSLTSN